MSSGNKQLVKFIGQGIGGSSQNAKHRPLWPPKPAPRFAGKAVKKKGENGIFNQVGEFAQKPMKKIEGAPGNVQVQETECPDQKPSGEIRVEGSGRKVKNQGGPRQGYSPSERRKELDEINFHSSSFSSFR